MSDVVIQVDRLWKKYRLGVLGTGTLRHDFNRWLHRTLGKPDPYAKVGEAPKREERRAKREDGGSKTESRSPLSALRSPVDAPSPLSPLPSPSSSLRDDEMWALRDVSFEVKQGEILGIIGRNGAGKSTLLKILSRVTAPTSGEVRVKGRIASLLEVGTGFHPELTGRENIFLNGAILGMTKAEIKSKLDEIVAFAEIERFLDTPVKRYSSGMYVRLAFAVAAHLEPDILIVDEVLAVGDAEFQKKCLGKMQDAAKGGRTVLFVSHNMSAVEALCSRGILLEGGSVILDGSAPEAVRRYLRDNASGGEWHVHKTCASLQLERVMVSYETDEEKGSRVRFELEIKASAPVDHLFVDVGVENEGGQRILQYVAKSYEKPLQVTGASSIAIQHETFISRLLPGVYRSTVYCYSPDKGELLYITNIPAFDVASYHDRPEVYQTNFNALLVPRFSTRSEIRPLH
jgi:lipopolysaccharide transport system ATP-binding protein